MYLYLISYIGQRICKCVITELKFFPISHFGDIFELNKITRVFYIAISKSGPKRSFFNNTYHK